MTREKDPRGKIFIIGGGIANFTDVAATFKGLIRAINTFQEDIRRNNVSSPSSPDSELKLSMLVFRSHSFLDKNLCSPSRAKLSRRSSNDEAGSK